MAGIGQGSVYKEQVPVVAVPRLHSDRDIGVSPAAPLKWLAQATPSMTLAPIRGVPPGRLIVWRIQEGSHGGDCESSFCVGALDRATPPSLNFLNLRC